MISAYWVLSSSLALISRKRSTSRKIPAVLFSDIYQCSVRQSSHYFVHCSCPNRDVFASNRPHSLNVSPLVPACLLAVGLSRSQSVSVSLSQSQSVSIGRSQSVGRSGGISDWLRPVPIEDQTSQSSLSWLYVAGRDSTVDWDNADAIGANR